MNTPHFPAPAPGEPRPWRYSVHLRWLLTLGVWFIILFLLFYFFDQLRMILLSLLFASAIACMLRPLLRFVPGPHWLRGLIVGVGFVLLVAAALSGLGWLLSAPVRQELAQWPKLHHNLNNLLGSWSHRLGMSQTLDVQTIANRFLSFATGAGASSSGPHVISSATSLLSDILITLALVFVGMIYILVEPDRRLTAPLADALAPPRRDQLLKSFDDLDHRLRAWLIGVVISVCLIGSLSWVGYHFVNLNFALPLAIFAGCAEIVPTIGALTASLLAILVAATQNSMFTLVGVIIVHSVTLFIDSYIIIPVIMRRAVRVPPAVTLFTVVLWAKLLGIGGLILAIPLDLLAWTFYQNFILIPRQTPPRPIPQPRPRTPQSPP